MLGQVSVKILNEKWKIVASYGELTLILQGFMRFQCYLIGYLAKEIAHDQIDEFVALPVQDGF